jgi:hypothetical protein
MRKVEIAFHGYRVATIDLDDPSTCNVFENLATDQVVERIEMALMGDADESGFVSANIGGEHCYVRRI